MCTVSLDTELYVYYYNCLSDLNQMEDFYKLYLEHIIKHKEMVYLAWLYISNTLLNLGFINENDMDGINKLMVNHDDSKFKADEFKPYAKRFNGPRQKSPIVKQNFKKAVRLHKERNIHHFETLKSYNNDNWKHYAIELICDYIAMGWEFNNYIFEYFQNVKDELKSELPNEYYNFIESIISIIPEQLTLAEEPLTENNVGYIVHLFDYYNDPFESYGTRN